MHSAVLVIWSGISGGSTSAFVALGMALVLRSTGVMNFAQGEFFVIGALVASAVASAGVPLVLSLLAGGAVGCVGCAAQEFTLTRRTGGATASVHLLITVALAIALEGLEFLIWGPDSRGAAPLINGKLVGPAGVPFSYQSLLVVGAAILAAFIGYIVFERGGLGEAMDALSEDQVGAQLIGIRTYRLRAWAATASGLVAGVGGALAVPLYVQNFSNGLPLALDGFIAVAIARGRLFGCVAVAFGLGIMSALITRYVSSIYVDAVTFGVLAAVVILQPGLIGAEAS